MHVGTLGSAIEIVDVLNKVADSVLISIEDSSNIRVVNSVAMTKVADKVYSYVYKSSILGTSGIYTVIIEVVKDDISVFTTQLFELTENPLKD